MTMATETISQDLADLLVTKNFDPKYTDEAGRDSAPGEAVVFSFDWVAQSGKNYGTAVAVLGDQNDLQLFFGDNLGRSMENPDDKNEWFQFLEQMSNFATQHRYTWSPKDINQLKHTMAGMAAIKEGLFEGYYGTRKVSYMGEQTSARLVIKHNRMLGENDKRYRYVESLYIETADGERFKLPFTKLAGGRAMLEHVRQGGKPYDIRGSHICEIVTEMNLLARFNRASQSRVFEGSTAALVESAQSYYQTLQENLKHLSSSRGYSAYFESWSAADINSEDALVEDIKTLFVEQTLDARIESALPLLAKIQQGTAMKEVQVFENWITNMAEGTWALPDTPEQEAQLQKLMGSELVAGPDGTNATEQLYDLVGDDQLFDLIQSAAAADPNSNIWDNAEIIQRLGQLGVDTTAITQRGAEQPEQDVAEEQFGPAATAAIQQGKSPDAVHYADSADKMNKEFHNIGMAIGKEQFKESRMADVDIIIQNIINGEADPYNLLTSPTTPEEQYVSKMLQQEYEDVAIDYRLHPDDDFEQILDRVVDRLEQKYGHQMDEADTINSFAESGTVAGGMAPVQNSLEEEDQWGQAKQDPMNYNAAITGSYYESEDPLARLKTLALSK